MPKHRLSGRKIREVKICRVGVKPLPPRELKPITVVPPPQPPPPPPTPPISAWMPVIAHDPPAEKIWTYLYIEAYTEDGETIKHFEKLQQINGFYAWLEESYEVIEASPTHLHKHLTITIHYGDGSTITLYVDIDITPQQMNQQEPPEGLYWIHSQWLST